MSHRGFRPSASRHWTREYSTKSKFILLRLATCGTTAVSMNKKVFEEIAPRKFEACLSGEVIRPKSERYELARRLWIGMTNPRRPAVIIRCVATSDVRRCVEICRINELAIALRAGNHSMAGNSPLSAAEKLLPGNYGHFHTRHLRPNVWKALGTSCEADSHVDSYGKRSLRPSGSLRKKACARCSEWHTATYESSRSHNRIHPTGSHGIDD
jgi:hypothetical protein